ncbi:MAG: EamA family transporter [Candidatus Protochlamydia sp.]|nr:EamA family transporter [Candidatus Protochlamydia sp.]
MWQVFLMYALFGSIFTVGKVGLAASSPYFLTGVRMLMAGSLLFGYFCYRHPGKKITISKQDWQLLALIAFFNVFITNAFEFWGLQYMTAAKTCLIYSLSPFAAALIGYFFGTERLSGRKWLGLCIGFLSFCPLMLGPWLNGSPAGSDTLELMAEGALAISAITAVIGWTFVKQLTVDNQMPHPLVNGISFLLAGILCMLTSLSIETWDPVPVFIWTDFLWSVIYIVVIHNLICYSTYAASLRRFSVTFMAFSGLSCPLFAALFGWLFLDEMLAPSFWLAFAGILCGLYLFHQEKQLVQTA